MSKHIGFKLIEAEPQLKDNQEGYKVVYPDGYVSWSPKEVFESAYMQVGNNNTITQANVDSFIKDTEVITLDGKTTVVKAVLVNGFVIVESSSCVDPANYCEKMGAEICLERIKNQIWMLLGFLLQTAKEGIK
ncbi:hypothetical protein IUK39_03590 [Priestia aryabhattai]|uniref:Gp49 family protein n=1 Tax=Priestia aryabhattai TaxID=412384 RepID=UPI001ECF0535|nr:Gp49 family protein [Priestia aryabhattai]MBU3569260.1 hypothetical protein [Priestia aryabhattai]